MFLFDFADGWIDIEYALTPETAASDGSFVDPLSNETFERIRNGRFSHGPLTAGRRYWHVRMDEYDVPDEQESRAWSPVMVLNVRDEPAVFDGWTLKFERLRKLKGRGGCPIRLRARGKIAWYDNDRTPRAQLRLSLYSGSRLVAKSQLPIGSDGLYDMFFCPSSRRRVTRVVPSLVDRVGHRTRGSERRV